MRVTLDRVRGAAKVSEIVLCGFLLLLCMLPTGLTAQAAAAAGPRCFAIGVHLNGQAIEGPHSVTLKTSKAQETVSLSEKCFKLPIAMLASELIEVSFVVPGSNIHISDIPTDFFNGMWDVQLADKKFASDVNIPKHVNVAGTCAVVFHGGETEQSLSQPQCRTPLSAKAAAPPPPTN